jgi:hypothetical protein
MEDFRHESVHGSNNPSVGPATTYEVRVRQTPVTSVAPV